ASCCPGTTPRRSGSPNRSRRCWANAVTPCATRPVSCSARSGNSPRRPRSPRSWPPWCSRRPLLTEHRRPGWSDRKMCGVAAWVDFERDLREQSSTVRTMVATLANRGPDAEAVWTDERAALGFRRLAVIDLVTGDQPMVAEEDGRVLAVLVHNGEVYNYRQLREELVARGHRFR